MDKKKNENGASGQLVSGTWGIVGGAQKANTALQIEAATLSVCIKPTEVVGAVCMCVIFEKKAFCMHAPSWFLNLIGPRVITSF